MSTRRPNQPSYNFLSGEPDEAALRKTLRASSMIKPDSGNEDLRAAIKTLEYELSSLKQDRDLIKLQHDSDLREVRARADGDHRRAQAAEASASSASAKAEALSKQIHDQQEAAAVEKTNLERTVRRVEGQKQALQEELDEALEKVGDAERIQERKQRDWEGQHNALQQSYDQIKEEAERKDSVLHATQQKLAQRETQNEEMEAELIKLRASGGDSEALDILKRDLSEQVAHIRKLESANREQLQELQEFRKVKKSIEIVEEEKRTLENKLRLMQGLRTELAEVRIRNDSLEAEHRSWATYLQSQASGGAEFEFDSPEELARAFMTERLEKASLLDQLGSIQPELTTKDEEIQALENSKAELQKQITQLKGAGSDKAGEFKAKARIERQKNLAVKETAYLREQLKTLDAEESEMNPERYSATQATRIQELESLVDQYRTELDTLESNLSKLEATPSTPSTSLPIGSKRPLEQPDDERIGELLRKNKALQESHHALQTRFSVLESDLAAKSTQLTTIKASSRYRILELRNNPTSSASAIKQATLDALRAENETLSAQIANKLPTHGPAGDSQLVPSASLTTLQLSLDAKDTNIANLEKKSRRLREIFSAKGLEFREAVFSLLGWQLSFEQNGKVKASSMFYPKPTDGGVRPYIEFDGEHGTMKVSGGTESEFAREIRGLIEFWVDGKRQVPCFLAAMTLEFFEKYGDVAT
ncbi:MAD-domain-containing protein [Microthyrium microscopicum]|uniref:Spindle assembly checkpoint component MAD1 n=1 Tax=Microthyrium microscopicum TaxID=703497 RepID=A0A6A6TZC7_9PEZI|nr:MAD-domain-containing protein [Microthyrium microscopicum]